MAQLSPYRSQFFDDAGDPLNGGKVYFYAAGTSTPQDTYTNQGGGTANANPVVLDAYGRAAIWLGTSAYKVVLKTSADVTIWTEDNVQALAVPVPVAQGGTGSTTAATARTALGAAASGANSDITSLTGLTTPLSAAQGGTGGTVAPKVCDGRLTLTSGTAVTTSDVTAATTIYFTPYKGNGISLYSGSAWSTISFSEISIAVPSTASTVYDVFCYNNSGTATLELTAWSSTTARATALTLQDGVLVKSGTTTRRYLGSFATTATTGKTEDSFANRLVFNYANRVNRPVKVVDTTNTWDYTTATWRQANNSTANGIKAVCGYAEDSVSLRVVAGAKNSTGSVIAMAGIGLNVTNANSAQVFFGSTGESAGNSDTLIAEYSAIPSVGLNTYAWLEYSAATGTTTWIGDDGGRQSGMLGTVRA